jgi:hypothetical protein
MRGIALSGLISGLVIATGCGASSSHPVTTRDANGRRVTTASPIRYVVDGATIRVDASVPGRATVLAATYSGLDRATNQNPWDLYDPVSKRFIAQYTGRGGAFLWSVAGGAPERVFFEGMEAEPAFQEPFVHGVLSADGKLVYLSTEKAAYVARRTGEGLTFSALRPLGHDVQLVHDISWDNQRLVASGHRPTKWGDPANVVAPRMVSVFGVAADGTLGADLTAEYPALQTDYIQAPSFMSDSRSLLYEGDDDIDTGDRLYVFRPGEGQKELSPDAVEDRDFNTPCVLPDDRVVFFESADRGYLIRVHDAEAGTTETVDDTWYPFSGYVRCR